MLQRLVEQFVSEGRSHFMDSDIATPADKASAVSARLRRLRKKRYIFTPVKGFHVIVPDVYRSFGSIPPEQYIDPLMTYLNLDYYVGLLSAAKFLGASHQKPMTFQVFTEKSVKNIEVGDHKVHFIQSQDVGRVKTKPVKTRTGYFKVSALEPTIYDLVKRHQLAGSLNNVATVVHDLIDENTVDFDVFSDKRFATNILQRLGYLLGTVNLKDESESLFEAMHLRNLTWTPLVKGKSTAGSGKDSRWMILVNETVEADL